MSGTINTPKQLNTRQIKNMKQRLLEKFNLEEKFLMSTSGRNYVVQCINEDKKRFLLKMRRLNTKQNKKEFTKEALIYKFFEKRGKQNLLFPKNVIIDPAKEKTYLIYDFARGHEAGTYFFIHGRAKRHLDPRMIFNALDFLHKWSKQLDKKMRLDKMNRGFILDFIKKHKLAGEKLLGKNLSKQGHALVNENINLLTKNLVLNHGDFNPKNVLLPIKNKKTLKNKLLIIDWSDAFLANPFWDLAYIFLASWNYKKLNTAIVKEVGNNKKILDLNCLILIPKFIEITQDYIKAIKYEYKSGWHSAATKNTLLKTADDAREYYKNLYKKLVKGYN